MERGLGPEHPDVAMSLNNLATLYQDQGRYGEAEPLVQRALAIMEQRLGPDHPHVEVVRRGYLTLLRATDRHAEADTSAPCRIGVIPPAAASGTAESGHSVNSMCPCHTWVLSS